MKAGLSNLMKQAQDMQATMEKVQDEIAKTEIYGESGAGMVKVRMTGRHDVTRIEIDQELIGDDKEMLEDLVAAAVNDAVRKVESMTKEKMSGITSGFNLPEGLKLPF
tara:strand:+ start:82 stop:405 length:324 start_codon:yes stop_codon:yes gene_type:complete